MKHFNIINAKFLFFERLVLLYGIFINNESLFETSFYEPADLRRYELQLRLTVFFTKIVILTIGLSFSALRLWAENERFYCFFFLVFKLIIIKFEIWNRDVPAHNFLLEL